MCSTLFYISLPLFSQLQRETSRNCLVIHFMEQISYMFLFTFFSLSLIFNMVAASISHFLTAATKFHVFLNKRCLLCFFSLALALFLIEIHQPVSLLSLSLYSKFVGMTILITLNFNNTLHNTDTEIFSAFRFRHY